MKHLLDVNVLIAGIVVSHGQHPKALAWLEGKNVVICPLVELGFLRICTNPQVMGFTMPDARRLLENFLSVFKAERIADDLPALGSRAATHTQVTDRYLADLAAKHGFILATLDERLSHPSAELVQ